MVVQREFERHLYHVAPASDDLRFRVGKPRPASLTGFAQWYPDLAGNAEAILGLRSRLPEIEARFCQLQNKSDCYGLLNAQVAASFCYEITGLIVQLDALRSGVGAFAVPLEGSDAASRYFPEEARGLMRRMIAFVEPHLEALNDPVLSARLALAEMESGVLPIQAYSDEERGRGTTGGARGYYDAMRKADSVKAWKHEARQLVEFLGEAGTYNRFLAIRDACQRVDGGVDTLYLSHGCTHEDRRGLFEEVTMQFPDDGGSLQHLFMGDASASPMDMRPWFNNLSSALSFIRQEYPELCVDSVRFVFGMGGASTPTPAHLAGHIPVKLDMMPDQPLGFLQVKRLFHELFHALFARTSLECYTGNPDALWRADPGHAGLNELGASLVEEVLMRDAAQKIARSYNANVSRQQGLLSMLTAYVEEVLLKKHDEAPRTPQELIKAVEDIANELEVYIPPGLGGVIVGPILVTHPGYYIQYARQALIQQKLMPRFSTLIDRKGISGFLQFMQSAICSQGFMPFAEGYDRLLDALDEEKV